MRKVKEAGIGTILIVLIALIQVVLIGLRVSIVTWPWWIIASPILLIILCVVLTFIAGIFMLWNDQGMDG